MNSEIVNVSGSLLPEPEPEVAVGRSADWLAEGVVLSAGTAVAEAAGTLESATEVATAATLESRVKDVVTEEALGEAEVAVVGAVVFEAGWDATGLVEPPDPLQLPTGPPGAE